MSDDLKSRIQNDMKEAMKAKEKLRLSTVRMLIAGIKQREIDDQTTLDNNGVLGVVNKMIKQRRDSAAQYKDANRQDLYNKEVQEIAILEAYLPAQLSDDEVDVAVKDAIIKSGASSIKDMGKVMAILKDELTGRANMAAVSQHVKENLS